jgi:hypothetical protein
MADSVLVRNSRDGDPLSGLVAVTIEGASPGEISGQGRVEEREEDIDVAEYYGSEHLAQATLIRYIQLKHGVHGTKQRAGRRGYSVVFSRECAAPAAG